MVPNIHTLSPAEAPRADLTAIEEMKMYKEHDKDVAEMCLRRMANRGWYLFKTFITLSLVDPKVK